MFTFFNSKNKNKNKTQFPIKDKNVQTLVKFISVKMNQTLLMHLKIMGYLKQ